MTREAVCELAGNDDLLFCDGFDDCLLGIASRCAMEAVAVYDVTKMLQQLVEDGMSEEEAQEHFEFNIHGAWVGPYTPLFLTRLET